MPRVLVVDDDPQVQTLVRVNLELEGYDVEAVRNGEEALSAIYRRIPDLVVCDVMMPGLDGIEVVRRLREDVRTEGLPVILLSAKAQRSDAEAGKRAGADAYVTKPFDPQDLLDAVAKLLSAA